MSKSQTTEGQTDRKRKRKRERERERERAKQVYFDVLKGLSEQERNGGCKMLMHL